MREYDYINVSGYISVTVDAVDIEQIGIEQPGLEDAAAHVKAFAAAQRKPGFQKIQRAIMRSGFTLEADDYKYAGGGKIEVIFITAMMAKESEAAA